MTRGTGGTPLAGQGEAARVESFYREHLADERVLRRWDPANPGNQRAVAQRELAVDELLAESGLSDLSACRVLDVGCGTGAILGAWVERGVPRESAVGVDLLQFRLEQARQRRPELSFVRASGAALPFRDGSVEVVVAYTLFSSILSPVVARTVASEIDRVLGPGGRVVWYDFRIRRPGNRNTRGVPLREMKARFPGYRAYARSVTLAPPLARVLGPAARWAYQPLCRVPLLRTHHVGVFVKGPHRDH